MGEHLTFNQGVSGSSPDGITKMGFTMTLAFDGKKVITALILLSLNIFASCGSDYEKDRWGSGKSIHQTTGVSYGW